MDNKIEPVEPGDQKKEKGNDKKPTIAIAISIFAVLVTIFMNLLNLHYSNNNWAKLNNSEVVLSNAEFIVAKTFPGDSIPDLGYPFPFIGINYTSQGGSKVNLFSYISAWKDTTFTKPIKTDKVFSINEMFKAIKKINYPEHNVIFCKSQTIQFAFKNTGRVDATEFVYTIQVQDAAGWKVISSGSTPEILHDSPPMSFLTTFSASLNAPVPDSLNFKINYSYDDINENRIEKHLSQTWRQSNYIFFNTTNIH